jgi:hypothetical protein
MKTAYIVWNKDKTEGFVTTDKGVAYEARKGAKTNCFDAEGRVSTLAIRFCDLYSDREDCTIQPIDLGVIEAIEQHQAGEGTVMFDIPEYPQLVGRGKRGDKR